MPPDAADEAACQRVRGGQLLLITRLQGVKKAIVREEFSHTSPAGVSQILVHPRLVQEEAGTASSKVSGFFFFHSQTAVRTVGCNKRPQRRGDLLFTLSLYIRLGQAM